MKKLCSIELPWKDNNTLASCIPERIYELAKSWSLKFNFLNVPKRNFILIHPANEALRELKGCIAPVCFLTGAGKGICSSPALCGMENLMGLVGGALDRHETVFITIASKPYESD